MSDLKDFEGIHIPVSVMTCRECKFFDNDPKSLESLLPGFNILGSAYSSVRGDSGICSRRNIFLFPVKSCEQFEPGTNGDRT